jgi:hypothetical protein
MYIIHPLKFAASIKKLRAILTIAIFLFTINAHSAPDNNISFDSIAVHEINKDKPGFTFAAKEAIRASLYSEGFKVVDKLSIQEHSTDAKIWLQINITTQAGWVLFSPEVVTQNITDAFKIKLIKSLGEEHRFEIPAKNTNTGLVFETTQVVLSWAQITKMTVHRQNIQNSKRKKIITKVKSRTTKNLMGLGNLLARDGFDPGGSIQGGSFSNSWLGWQARFSYSDASEPDIAVNQWSAMLGPAIRHQITPNWNVRSMLFAGAQLHHYSISPADVGYRLDASFSTLVQLGRIIAPQWQFILETGSVLLPLSRSHTLQDLTIWASQRNNWIFSLGVEWNPL